MEDVKAVQLLRRSTGLDKGESEAIILSDSIHADLLLMDEVKGRRVAKQMGICLMGTIGMLMVAYEEQKLSKDEILECIDILMGRDNLEEQLLRERVLQSEKEC